MSKQTEKTNPETQLRPSLFLLIKILALIEQTQAVNPDLTQSEVTAALNAAVALVSSQTNLTGGPTLDLTAWIRSQGADR